MFVPNLVYAWVKPNNRKGTIRSEKDKAIHPMNQSLISLDSSSGSSEDCAADYDRQTCR